MVYAVLLIELILLLPFVTLIRKNPHYVPYVWFAIGLLMFMYPGFRVLGLSVYAWPLYAGHNKGIEITIIDILTVALLLAQGRDATGPKPPFRAAMALYFVVTVISISYAQIQVAAVMYAAQLPRMYLLYIAVFRASAQPRNTDALLKGLAMGLICEFGLVLYQKYVGGSIEPSGTFVHRNALGLASNLVYLPMISLLLASRTSRVIGFGALTGMATTAMLASRASAGLAGIGISIVYVMSVALKPSGRKGAIGFAGLGIAAVIIPLALNSLEQRKSSQGNSFGDSDYDERAAFISAASSMLRDHPLGVGANNFVIVANTGGYYSAAGVAAVQGSRSAHVHNIYWLTLAELGYLGFAALVWMFAGPLLTALQYQARYRNREESNLLLGLFVALLVTYVHSYYEWAIITTISQHFLSATWGMVAGVAARLKAPPQAATPSPSTPAAASAKPLQQNKSRSPARNSRTYRRE